MPVTIRQIAEVCGVSRGTVDRVLNNRGNVKPETEKMVREVARQLGYRPSFAGKALAARKKDYVIAVILSSVGNPFFDEVIKGFQDAADELVPYGVEVVIKLLKGYKDTHQIKLIEELEHNMNALIINPADTDLMREKIESLKEKGIPTITVNTDLQDSNRLLYVGSDYLVGGRTASGMMNFIAGGKAKLGVVQGSAHVYGHAQRIDGFREGIEKTYTGMEIVDICITEDDDIVSYEKTKEMLTNHPEIDGVFIASGGSYGACRAIETFLPERKFKVVCFDSTPSNVEMMKKGIVQAIIDQEPYRQGYMSLKHTFDALINLTVDTIITKTEIKIIENVDENTN